MEKNIEFEEMKQQLRLLQQRIDKQIEINEKQTRRAIKDGIGSIRRKDQRNLILCIIGALVLPLVCLEQGLPVYFVIGTFIFLLANAVWQYLISFDGRKLASMNLVETAKSLTQYKKKGNLSILIGFPIALCWVYCYGIESSKIGNFADEDVVGIFISSVIGSTIGFLIGLKIFYLPKMRAIDHLLYQIEEVQSEITRPDQ